MAGKTLEWVGLKEFQDFLRTLPRDLGAEAGVIVTQAATLAEGEIRQRYGVGKTGKLARSLKLTMYSNPYGALGVVRNTAKHAAIYEFGSQVRQTRSGAKRGAMPPRPTVIPVSMKHRRAMIARLRAMVERHGFTVSG